MKLFLTVVAASVTLSTVSFAQETAAPVAGTPAPVAAPTPAPEHMEKKEAPKANTHKMKKMAHMKKMEHKKAKKAH